MDNKLKELKRALGPNRIRVNEPMEVHTTFKIGGPAQYYLETTSIDDFVKAVKTARKLEISVFILGGGSNILVSDKGIKGLVIKNNCRRFELIRMRGQVRDKKIALKKALVYAESGVVMNQLVRFTIEQGLSGLEYQLGLPGTVGGAIYMNSNFPQKKAYAGDCVYKAKLLTPEGEIREVTRSYFKFDYDKSVLQETGEIVLSVIFEFLPMDKKKLWERGMETLNYRERTQPKGFSAGCIFRNLSPGEAMRALIPNGATSAGYLIDKAGLKGEKIGEAIISPLHASFILNLGRAKAAQVMNLIDLVRDNVYEKFNIRLSLEVQTVGF